MSVCRYISCVVVSIETCSSSSSLSFPPLLPLCKKEERHGPLSLSVFLLSFSYRDDRNRGKTRKEETPLQSSFSLGLSVCLAVKRDTCLSSFPSPHTQQRHASSPSDQHTHRHHQKHEESSPYTRVLLFIQTSIAIYLGVDIQPPAIYFAPSICLYHSIYLSVSVSCPAYVPTSLCLSLYLFIYLPVSLCLPLSVHLSRLLPV